MLPMIVVQNQIRDMLGGERGKITFRRIKYKLRPSSNNNCRLCTVHIGRVGGGRHQSCWVLDSVCHAQGFGLLLAKGCDCITALIPPVHKNNLWSFDIHQLDSCLCLIRDVVMELAQFGLGENSWQRLSWASWNERLRWKTGVLRTFSVSAKHKWKNSLIPNFFVI